MLDSGTTVFDSGEWVTGGVTLQSSYANVGDGSTAVLFTIPKAKYRSGKCIIQAVSLGGATEHCELTEFSFVHNGSEVRTIEHGTVAVGSNTMTVYEAAIDSTNVLINVTADSPDDNTVQFIGTITLLHTTQV